MTSRISPQAEHSPYVAVRSGQPKGMGHNALTHLGLPTLVKTYRMQPALRSPIRPQTGSKFIVMWDAKETGWRLPENPDKPRILDCDRC